MAVIGIELLTAVQGCDFHAPLTSSEALENVRRTVRAQIPHLDEDRYLHTDLQRATELVRSGAVTRAVSGIELPSILSD